MKLKQTIDLKQGYNNNLYLDKKKKYFQYILKNKIHFKEKIFF